MHNLRVRHFAVILSVILLKNIPVIAGIKKIKRGKLLDGMSLICVISNGCGKGVM